MFRTKNWGRKAYPKLGTESGPKMGTHAQNASGLAIWPLAQGPKPFEFTWLGT